MHRLDVHGRKRLLCQIKTHLQLRALQIWVIVNHAVLGSEIPRHSRTTCITSKLSTHSLYISHLSSLPYLSAFFWTPVKSWYFFLYFVLKAVVPDSLTLFQDVMYVFVSCILAFPLVLFTSVVFDHSRLDGIDYMLQFAINLADWSAQSFKGKQNKWTTHVCCVVVISISI